MRLRPVGPRPRGALAAALVLLPLAAAAGPEAFRTSRHADPVEGPVRDRQYRPGTCLQCHGSPPAARGAGPSNRMALFAPNDNALCLGCHEAGAFADRARVSRATHTGSPRVVWPGPKPKARPRSDGGLCLNCHDPHGRIDAQGPIPGMLLARGDALCLACHRPGGGGPDVESELAEVSHHPRFRAGVGGASVLQGTVCVDCHDPHRVRRDPSAVPGARSGLLDGVRRVRLVNGAAGALPQLVPVPADDRAPVLEYEVCFRCHAGVAGEAGAGAQPASAGAAVARGEVASAFNPANASFHPVEAPGRGAALDPAAFVGRWRSGTTVTCSDCHGSAGGRARGPHGSSFPRLLRRRYPAAAAAGQVEAADLCFECHAHGAYAAAGAGAAATASRYGGHASHSAQGVSCHACHDPHGSPRLPSLLVLRTPGLVAYQRDPAGGSCTVSCHTRTPPTATYRMVRPR